MKLRFLLPFEAPDGGEERDFAASEAFPSSPQVESPMIPLSMSNIEVEAVRGREIKSKTNMAREVD